MVLALHEPGVNAGPITACGGNARKRAWRGPQADAGFSRRRDRVREDAVYVIAQLGFIISMSQNAISSLERDERRKLAWALDQIFIHAVGRIPAASSPAGQHPFMPQAVTT